MAPRGASDDAVSGDFLMSSLSRFVTSGITRVDGESLIEGPNGVYLADASNGALLANGATTARSLAAMGADVENFYSYGGIDGDADNTAAINATIAASVASGRSAWFPANTINTTGNHKIPAGTPPILAVGTNFQGNGTSNDCFIFESGSHQIGHAIGAIGVFNGAGLRLQDCSFLGVTVGNIGACGVGVCFNVVSGSVLNCNVNFQTLYSSSIAVEYLSTVSNAVFQGNVVNGNFINGCGKAVYFNLASSDNACNLNYFWVSAIDGLNGVSSGVNGSGFSCASGGGQPTQTTIQVPGFFGNITGPAFAIGNVNICEFSLQGSFTAFQFQTPVVATVYKNIYDRSSQQAIIPAVTACTDAASFNGGQPLFTMEQIFSITVPALAAGATADFYVFHAFTIGYTQMFDAVPRFSQPLILSCVEDISVYAGVDGNVAANCVHIRVTAAAAVAASTHNLSLKYAGG
jgi:hypothetical protein